MSAFNLNNEQVAKAIADVVHDDWQPNGTRAEGYSVMVAKKGDGFCLDNVKVERLRLRLNTIDQLFNPHHRPLAMWRVKDYNDGIELRFIHVGESAYDYKELERVRLYDDSDGEPHDGILSFAAYLFRVAYTAGIGRSKNSVIDLANDFVYGTKNSQYIFVGQQLYDHIWNQACADAQDALNEAVTDYRRYCVENDLAHEVINKK